MSTSDLRAGNGEPVKEGDRIAVLYEARLADGRKVNEARDRTKPFTFEVGTGEVIRGFSQGVVGMRAGGTRRITVPSKLAYGAEGVPGVIPPGAAMTFEVELLRVN